MRFFADTDATTRVRWYFVEPDTPFVPYPNNWVSSNWDDDPKPAYHLGEQPDAARVWADGTGPIIPEGGPICGTAEQWRTGQALPPATPVPLSPDGVPLCCLVGVPPAVPTPPLTGLRLWLRPEDLPALYNDLDPVAFWPSNGGTVPGAFNIPPESPPTYLAAGGGGGGSVLFTTGPTPLRLSPDFTLTEAMSVYGVCIFHFNTPQTPEITFIGADPVTAGRVSAKRTTLDWWNNSFFASQAVALVKDRLYAFGWRVLFAPWEVETWANGVQVGSTLSFAGPFNCRLLGWQRFAATGIGQEVAEVIVYDRKLADDENADVFAYLSNKYGV